jgi:hypothetical protein
MKPKYTVTKRMAGEFGNKAHCFVISKLTWFGFYWDTNEYYLSHKSASKRCDELNKKQC